MGALNGKLVKIGAWILKQRWYLVGLIGAVVIFIELEEHAPLGVAVRSGDFWRETILFGLVLPLTNGLLFSLVVHIREDREMVTAILDRQNTLSLQLSRMSQWKDVTATVVNFPRTLLPVAATTLHIYNPDVEQYQLADQWVSESVHWPGLEQEFPRSVCQRCAAGPAAGGQLLKPCESASDHTHPRQYVGYCLPLSQGQETIGILHLYFPGEPILGAQAVRTLTGSAPEMAMAIERARLEAAALNQAEATSAERRRIARDLHDTLGQNVSYLRLKLDQMTGEDALGEISLIRNELEHMRDIASDAYVQVRSTLAELQPECPSDLTKSLRDHLRLVGGRAGFKPLFHADGQPRPVSAHTRRQVMYIFREILNNVEKHAAATKVRAELLWKESGLTLHVVDDGQGFEMLLTPRDGHFGLGIMQERAAEISGTISVHSSPGHGVRVTLQAPYRPQNGASGEHVAAAGQANGVKSFVSKN